jgi:hypothetical protein
LLKPDTLATLKRELAPAVKCPFYGAWIEREAFESVVGRVLGPEMERHVLRTCGLESGRESVDGGAAAGTGAGVGGGRMDVDMVMDVHMDGTGAMDAGKGVRYVH